MSVKEMLDHIRTLPEQLEYCLQLDYNDAVVLPKKDIKNVVVAGMGGSAIGGDVMRCSLGQEMPVPVINNRDYHLPSFVGKDSLVFTVSYSGNTEETLSCFREGLQRGAQMVAITSGGQLESLARESQVSLIKIPSGVPPRAALGYLFTPLALMVEQAGLVREIRNQVEETIGILKEMREELLALDPPEANPAWKIALDIQDCIPVIWAGGSILEVAAMRWKGQINENAKAPAYFNCFPELNHNEFTGLEGPADITRRVAVIVLQDELQNPGIARRIKTTNDMLKDRIKGFNFVSSRGNSIMARLFSLMYAGDFTSVYLAQLYNIDPVPVDIIEELKKRLKN